MGKKKINISRKPTDQEEWVTEKKQAVSSKAIHVMLPEELYKKVNIARFNSGITLKEFVISSLEKRLENETTE